MNPRVSEIDPRLLEDIRAGNCVAFVGAGFSAAAGLPAWPELVRAVARGLPPAERAAHQRTIDQLVGPGDRRYSHRELEMAAQLLFDAIGEERCRHLLRDTLRSEGLPPAMQLRLKHLLGIPFRAIVTTNFDPLLPGVPPDAVAYRRLLRTDRFGPWREATLRAALEIDTSPSSIVDAPDRPVVQLHGTLVHDATLVFTRSQYRRRLYASPAYLTVLKALLATSTVLFLGYSMRDAYLNELRAELVEAFQTDEAALPGPAGADTALAMLRRPLAWAVLEDVSDVARAYYERHEGLGVLRYETGPNHSDHSGFDAILERIYGETNPVHRLGQLLRGRRLLWLDPSPEHNALGRRLITEAVREVEGVAVGVAGHLVEAATCHNAVALLQQPPGFDLVLTHWGHGAGPDGMSNGEALLRETAALRARGVPMPPVMVFAGAGHEAENRRRALQLGAIGFTSNWAALMSVIERVLTDV
ncbi:MAG TPA: SIR2 family protein [Steroidobacteraceae bacterium]|nr:SIR2 family protein [Steroidobacteraceae bacterium]